MYMFLNRRLKSPVSCAADVTSGPAQCIGTFRSLGIKSVNVD